MPGTALPVTGLSRGPAAVIYALHAARGATLIFNGLGDTDVAIPTHAEPFFQDLQARTARLHGGAKGVFEFGFAPANCGHRPYWLTRPVALWLEQQMQFPNWTEEKVRSMPETKISDWEAEYDLTNNFNMEDRITELGAGGTLALGNDVPGYSREMLNVFTPEQWEKQKTNYILETWVAATRASANPNRAEAGAPEVVPANHGHASEP